MRSTIGHGVFVGVMLSPTVASAGPEYTPITAEAVWVRYHVTDAEGAMVREMEAVDHGQFFNRARCECGQAIGIDVRGRSFAEGLYDPTKLVQAFLGPMCAAAQVMQAELRPCALFAAQSILQYQEGLTASVAPVWLTNGVATGEQERDPDEATAAGTCAGGSGSSGVWMCAQTNYLAGCQDDEFFMSADDERAAGEPLLLSWDFEPPIAAPRAVDVEPFSAGALVSWEIDTIGDINGYRVLCAEAGSGAPPDYAGAPPDITAKPDGEHFFTAHDVCDGVPFTATKLAAPEGPAACGDGVVQGSEACDDGVDNDDEGLCGVDCRLRVPASLHGLQWAHVCSRHAAFNAHSVIVEGLKNGTTYDVVLVTYDAFGNPRAFPRALQVTPDAGLPSLVDTGCGCGSATEPGGPITLCLMGLGLRRRRACGRRRPAPPTLF